MFRMKHLCYIAMLSGIVFVSDTKRVVLDTEEGALSEDVSIDSEGGTILVTVGDVSKTESFVSTVNLHDLINGWTALKRIDTETCLLKPSTEKQYTEMRRSLENIQIKREGVTLKPVTLYWKVRPDVLGSDELGELVGDRIAKFCDGYKTYLLEPKTAPVASNGKSLRGQQIFQEPIQRGTKSGNRRYKRGNTCSWCWWCCLENGAADLNEVNVIEVGDKI